MGSGSVRVVVLNVFRLKAGVLQGAGNRQSAARSVGKRSRDVVSVGRSAVTGKLGVNFGAALFGVLQLFQNKNGASLAHYKAVAVFVKGAAGLVGPVVVLAGQGFEHHKGSDSKAGDCGFSSARNANVNAAASHHVQRVSQSVGSAGASRGKRPRRPLNAKKHAYVGGRLVGNKLRGCKRRNASHAGGGIKVFFKGRFDYVKASDSVSYHNAALFAGQVFLVVARVF